MFAQELGSVPGLPLSLREVEKRAELVNRIDGLFIPTAGNKDFFRDLAKRLRIIAKVSEDYMSDVPDSLLRVNITLRYVHPGISA